MVRLFGQVGGYSDIVDALLVLRVEVQVRAGGGEEGDAQVHTHVRVDGVGVGGVDEEAVADLCLQEVGHLPGAKVDHREDGGDRDQPPADAFLRPPGAALLVGVEAGEGGGRSVHRAATAEDERMGKEDKGRGGTRAGPEAGHRRATGVLYQRCVCLSSS